MPVPQDWRVLTELLNSNAVEYLMAGVEIIDRKSLFKNKRAMGRPQDFADLESLQAHG
jgi:hypothetical protein